MATFTILSPTAILGYGFPEASFQRGLACNPDLIAVDAGSADPGPYYLGAGKSFTDRAAVRRDLGKILECAAIAASPGSGADCALGILENDRFVLQALSDDRCFTPASVAAHTLYEKSNPCILPGPGGELDLREVHFEDIGRGRVAVSGSRFIASSNYYLKIEGARRVGYRCISMAGIRDPIMIASIGEVLEQVRTRVDTLLPAAAQPGSLHFHVYGRDAVMGPGEPMRGHSAHELGVVIDAVCPTQEAADTLCSLTRSTLLHFGYPARIATAGNLAFPFSPSDLRAGAVYEFSVYHLLRADPLGLFPLTVRELGQ